MKVGEEIQINNNESVKFSKCGDYLAVGYRKLLTVVDVDTSDIISTFLCSSYIKTLHWHHDSDLILCLLDGNRIQVFSLSDPEWICKIQEGEPGLKDAVWCPKNYYILMLAKLNVRISIWSLTGKIMACIDNPILKTDNFSFSFDGDYFAVITGALNNYKILIYSTKTWILNKEISCTCEIDSPSSPLWSPANLDLVIWDTLDPKTIFLEIYSMYETGRVGVFKKTEPYKLCMIFQVVWVPSGQFLLVGCCDECIYVLNYITWGVVTILGHSQVINEKGCEIYEEIRDGNNFNLIKQRPVTLTKLQPSISLIPKISCIKCDYGGNYVATECATMPAVLWIWEVGMFNLKAVIILRNIISNISWNYKGNDMLVCSKTNNIILWRPDNIMHVKFSTFFNHCLNNCFWCPNKDDKFFVISGSSLFIICDFDK